MKKIHYKTDEIHIMPISGLYIVSLCGRWINKEYDGHNIVEDKEKVTCDNCLKKIEKHAAKYNVNMDAINKYCK